MKATELHIGNLIYIIGDGIQDPERMICKVDGIHAVTNDRYVVYVEEDGQEEMEGNDFIQPIPLTEEWLIKFGFKNKETFGFNYYYKYFKQTDTKGCEQQSNFALGRKGTEVFINNVWICGIEYVHNLQNLYFALTGQELEIA
jgi:hypothetical protein